MKTLDVVVSAAEDRNCRGDRRSDIVDTADRLQSDTRAFSHGIDHRGDDAWSDKDGVTWSGARALIAWWVNGMEQEGQRQRSESR